MKKVSGISAVLGFMVLFLLPSVSLAQEESSVDKTLSPYFFAQSEDTSVDQLPLKSTSAEVNIAGVIADVRVTQLYKNEGSRPVEAIYVFPASTRAAVYGMKMTIGERVIVARIKKKDEARQEYEQARQQGKSASLFEQHRPNVFQMNVANIMPGDTIMVELNYTELLIPSDKIYEFVYPTVVGPRYSNQPAATAPVSEKWVENPYLHQGEAPPYTFDIKVNIAAGLPIQKIVCTSHTVNVAYDGPARALVTLDKLNKYGGNKDFILGYHLAGKKIESGMLLYKGEKENFFLLMLQPPKRVTPEQIPGREYIFIIDVSGSMHGFPLDISKKLLRDLIGNLRPTDKFNVLLFAGGSRLMAERSVPATPANVNNAINVIGNQQGGGGTELLPALKRALTIPQDENFSRTIVIATDGYVTVEEEVFDLIRNNLDNANVFAFGIGSSVNRHLIEGMAHAGMGEPFVITKPDEAPAMAEKFRKLVQSPVLTNIDADFEKFETYDVEPLSIPDVLADRPIVIFGKWKGRPEGKITMHGISGYNRYEEIIDLEKIRPSASNGALPYLWARHRIMLLSDYNILRPNDERIHEVTNLGLTYNLLTTYTSFVAADTEVRNRDGRSTTINQPLPLPEGVSDYAVGVVGRSTAPSVAPFTASKQMLSKEEDKPTERTIQDEEKRKKNDTRHITIGEIRVSPVFSKESIEKVIRLHFQELQGCDTDNIRKGKLVIRLVLNSDGTVRSIKVDSSSLRNHSAERCIPGKIVTWKFPESKGVGNSEVRFTLLFY
jgi:Ca-activated chloride channel family protein